MWIPTSFERKPATIEPQHGPAFAATELWADGVRICRAVERVAWDEAPIHLKWGTDCLAGDCADGARMSVRRAGSHVLFLPSFWWWLESEWSDKGYEDPPVFLQKGAMLLDRALYADLRSLVPELPVMPDLQPLAGWEAVRLLRFEAPVEVLGKASEPVHLRRSLVLRVVDWWDSDDQAMKNLEQSLDTWANSNEPVALKHLPFENSPVLFEVADGSGMVEWQPLSSGARDLLLLTPGFVVDKMPELPRVSDLNRLMVITQLGKSSSLKTEIWVDNRPLCDFDGWGLGVDLTELGRSVPWDGEYYIITCSCGVAGCAGIRRGVDVYREDGKVYWVVYQPGPERTFVFDEQEYRKTVDTALVEFRDLCARHPMSPLDRHRLAWLSRIDEPPRRI